MKSKDVMTNFSGAAPLSELLPDFATPFTQNARLVKLQLCEGGQLNDRLPAQEARGEEALSTPYKIEVTCQSPESGIELKHLLGLPAQIGILTAQAGGFPGDGDEAEVIRCGLVTEARALGADGGFARYRLTLEPPFALLRHRTTSRVFQDISVPDIVKTLLDEHLAANPAFQTTFAHRFEFSGLHTYPPRSYCLQYRETDLDFIERLLAEEGINYRFEHTGGATDTEDPQTPLVTLVAFDDPWRLPQNTQSEIRFHRADATESQDSLTDWTSQRQLGPAAVSLQSFDYKAAAASMAQRDTNTDQGEGRAETTLEDYAPPTLYYASLDEGLDRYARLRQQAHDRRKKTFFGAGTVRELEAGEWFQLTGHPDFDPYDAADAQFVVTRLKFTARNNLDTQSNNKEGAPVRPYTVEIEAQRRGLPLTPDFAHSRYSKPVSQGLQSALVVGPPALGDGAEAEEVYTDGMGRIKIQFHWQRQKEHPGDGARYDERSSCWIRVAYPAAGAGWGHQFIPRVGQEVLVDFLEGDIDRPVVTGVIYNGRHPPPYFSGVGHLPGNKTLSGIQTKEHFGWQYNELLFDDTAGEVRAKLSSEHGKTQLNLGYLTHPRVDGQAEPRGDGFELRTDRAGALRGEEGVLISAHGRTRAAGKQLDREEIIAQLEMALAIAKSLGDDADKHEADGTNIEPQQQLDERVKHWEDGTNTGTETAVEGKRIVTLGAPEGIAIATGANLNIATGQSVDIVSMQDTNHTVGQNWRVRVARSLSFFVQQMGMKLIAAAGKIHIKAQSDEIEIAAAKKLHLFSLEEIVLDAPKITLRAQGAGVEYGGGITSKTTGAYRVHAASHNHTGPASVSPEGALKSTGESFDQKLRLFWQGGSAPIANRPYRLRLDDGRVFEGTTDSEGHTQQAESDLSFARYQIELLPPQAAGNAVGAVKDKVGGAVADTAGSLAENLPKGGPGEWI
ncbi:MAG: type VI secretion system tip protein VgrG [Azoarcus sp.]|jgi:type VI secretion system secreted protein VgrG|nr:type VI secretion system tip protein VgrG [Azoarcus sp.]